MDFVTMTPEMTKYLNDIAKKYRASYTKFIDILSGMYDDETGFWWDTPLASRNVYLCQCFLDICMLRLILDYVQKHKLDEVIVKNSAMQQAVSDNLEKGSVHVVKQENRSIKAILKRNSWIHSNYSYYYLKNRIHVLQNYRRNNSLAVFQGREITMVGTYRVVAETISGTLRDRYFFGLKENSDEDIVFLSSFGEFNKREPQLLDVIHNREDHICIEDWIGEEDFREIEKYICWCRSIQVQSCRFDGMDVRALVGNALREGSWHGNALFGIARGNALCRIVEQWGLKIRTLIDWYEGQPSSNAMIRRFRTKFPGVPTMAYMPFAYGENQLGQFPSPKQIEKHIVPEYFSVMGKAWKKRIQQFSKDVKCVIVPSFRHEKIWNDVSEPLEAKGVLLVLPYFVDASTRLLTAFGEAIKGLDVINVGPIYIKNHPVNQHFCLSDYDVEEGLFRNLDITYLDCDMYEALQGKALVILSKTTSTLEAVLSGAYTVNFVPAGDLSLVALPEEVLSKTIIAYSAEDLRDCLRTPQKKLSVTDVEQLREITFTRVNRETVTDFLAFRPV